MVAPTVGRIGATMVAIEATKRRRDWLIGLAQGHPDWAIGFEDETWWSRFAPPALHAWTDSGRSLRLIEQPVEKGNIEPKALACYGMLVGWPGSGGSSGAEIWLRFVEGRPVSEATIRCLEWTCGRLVTQGKKALLLIWDNASWHLSQRVKNWIGEHNRQVKREGKGVRIVRCQLPIKSPWLNPIEPRWIHAKRQVVQPDGLLTAEELIQRVYDHFKCQPEEHIAIPEKVA